MTTESIMKAIAENIAFSFGDMPIYVDMVRQGFKAPCFFIEDKGADIKTYLGRRYYFKQNTEISYYFVENVDIEPRKLFEELEFIVTDEGVMRGRNVGLKKEKDRIVLSIEYGAFFMREDEETPFMEVLISNEKGK